MNDPQTIQELMNYIAERYAFTEEKYPELRLLDEQGRYAFAVRHLGIHFAKTAGKIVTVSEAVDHGGGDRRRESESRRSKISPKHTTTRRTFAYEYR
jgi:hypothetical protein